MRATNRSSLCHGAGRPRGGLLQRLDHYLYEPREITTSTSIVR
jgi:hypothetical protein